MRHSTLNVTRHMHIDVILKDGSYHHFPPRTLDVLLDSNRVMKFRRSSGWVTVGVDPVRVNCKAGYSCHAYHGPERRRRHH